MVRLVNKEQKIYQETDEEKKERLQRELDFAGEFGEVRKSQISAEADKIISGSRPKNPLKFVKLFNEIDDDSQGSEFDDSFIQEREPIKNHKKNSPRKKQKLINNIPLTTQEIDATKDESNLNVNGTKEKASTPKRVPKGFPQLVKIVDDSQDVIDDEPELVLQIPARITEDKKKAEDTKVQNQQTLQENNEEEDGEDEFFDASDKPQPAAPSDPLFQGIRKQPFNLNQSHNETYESIQNFSQVPTQGLNQTGGKEPNQESTQAETSTKISDADILQLKKKLYAKITGRSDLIPYGLENKYRDIYKLLEATVQDYESQSALVIGPKNSGKSTCLELALKELRSQVKSRKNEFILIKISGLTQETDKAAVKSIARQLDSEISRVYRINLKELNPTELLAKKSITETFSNILNILDKQVLLEDDTKTRIHIPIVFVIDDVEVYANPNRQTLLYNLFDLVENSATPITTICLSTKFTVKDQLEKRVRSRFSQRMIQFTKFDLEKFIEIVQKILSIDTLENSYETEWNAHVEQLISKSSNLRTLVIHNHLTVNNFKELFNHFGYPISRISIKQPFLNDRDFKKYSSNNTKSSLKHVVNSLSEIEISLLVSAARLVTKNDLNWINLNAAYEEYQSQAKLQNKTRSSNVFNMSVISTGFKIWSKERCEAPWGVLTKLGLLTPPTNAGKSTKTMDFSNNTVETKMWQLEVTLDELRFIVDSEKNVKSWTRL